MPCNMRSHSFVLIAGFAILAIPVCCALPESLAAQDTAAQVQGTKPIAYASVASKVTKKNSDSNKPATEIENVTPPQPPISCKVSAKGVLTDCRINDSYTLNDVANWFQDEHDRTLQLAVNSVTLAKKLERSLESCADEKRKN